MKIVFSVFSLSLSGSAIAFDCPNMPDAIGISHDVKSEVAASAGALGNLKAADVSVKTEVVAKDLFSKIHDVDKLIALQIMAATYCGILRESQIPDKADRWNNFQREYFKIKVPQVQQIPKPPDISDSRSAGTVLAGGLDKPIDLLVKEGTPISYETGSDGLVARYRQGLFGHNVSVIQHLRGNSKLTGRGRA